MTELPEITPPCHRLSWAQLRLPWMADGLGSIVTHLAIHGVDIQRDDLPSINIPNHAMLQLTVVSIPLVAEADDAGAHYLAGRV